MMALSNRHGWLVLTTGNKSEMSVGYATLYGDMAGGFAVIKDVPKTLVYELVRRRNERAGRELVPASVIDRAPSAELRPDQLDSDSLPPYDLLDRILEAYVERDQGREEMIAAGMPAATVDDVIAPGRPLRVQAAPGGAGDPDHAAGLRQGPAAADHQPLRRLVSPAAVGPRSSSAPGRRASPRRRALRRPRPRWCGRGGGPWRWTSAPPSVTGRMKLTLIDWPIAIIPSLHHRQRRGARADALDQGRHDAAVEEADRLAQLVAHLQPDPGVVGIVVEPLGADQRVEVGVQVAGSSAIAGNPTGAEIKLSRPVRRDRHSSAAPRRVAADGAQRRPEGDAAPARAARAGLRRHRRPDGPQRRRGPRQGQGRAGPARGGRQLAPPPEPPRRAAADPAADTSAAAEAPSRPSLCRAASRRPSPRRPSRPPRRPPPPPERLAAQERRRPRRDRAPAPRSSSP